MSKKNKHAPKREDMPYRTCAGVVLFNHQGKVFMGKRAPDESGEHMQSWQLPQGGIDKNEEPIDGALRELYEETSVSSVSILTAAPNWIKYDLPDALLGVALKGKYRGQQQKWFAMLFEGDEDEINVTAPGGGAHPAEFTEWRWVELPEIVDLIVSFKQGAYGEIVDAFKHIPQQIINGPGTVQ
jgi:putative (di)nucleoside polyphosphate hydrolase